MSTLYSPKIKTDGLVFMFDTGNKKSYPGEPTTNYGPASFGDWATEGTAERLALGNSYEGQPTYNCRTEVGASYKGLYKTVSGLRTAAGSSGTVTVSCMVRNNNSTSYNMFAYIGHDFTSTRNIAANSDWQKVQWTVNQSSMNNDYVEFRPYTNNASIYLEMTMPMVEVNKGHATQFVDGTRSATQGLIDRTGNTTIDLSNVSFDSNAQMTFDGTDDYGTITDSTLFDFGTGNFSMEAVVKGTNTSNYRAIFYHHYNSGFVYITNVTTGVMRVWIDLKVLNGNTNILDGNYHHTAFVRQGDTLSLYVDGELDASSTGWSSKNATNTSKGASIGRYIDGSTNYPWNGEILSLKAYNKALTSTEILQNFNATKSRFGL
jgi:hypothetical protein